MPTLITSIALSVAAVAAIAAGGTAMVAESSLPGDLLYPVKTDVNENIKAGLALSIASDAEVEADIALSRLEEAKNLATQSQLGSDLRSDLQSQFEMHSENAVTLASEAASNGNAEAALEVMTNFSQSIEAFQEDMNTIEISDTESEGQLSVIAASANSVQSSVDLEIAGLEAMVASDSQVQSSVDFDVNMKQNAESAIDAADNLVDETKVMLDSAVSAGAEVSEDAKVEFNAAVENMNRARIEFQQNAYESAQQFANDAKDATNRVRATIDSSVDSVMDDDASADVEGNASASVNTEADNESVDTSADTDVGATVNGALN